MSVNAGGLPQVPPFKVGIGDSGNPPGVRSVLLLRVEHIMETRVLSVPGRLAVLALLAWFPLGAAWAEEGDPPGRVARLSDAEGSVSLQPAGVQEWAAATLNRPLTTGDKLWTDQNSRAELDIGAAVIRVGATTGLSFLNLDDNTAQMQVTAGTLIVRVRDLQANQTYEVDTPNLALSLQQPGEYRVEVNDAGDTTVVKVSEGQAQAAGGGQSLAIGPQQLVRFTGTDTLSFESASLGAPDDLDSWSAGRERQVRDSPSRQYVAEDLAGTQDLDNNGRWESTPEYGYVWAPTVVVAGWAPYRFGHWVWIVPWGWTWVDDAPWGYAPFHYGRWVEVNSAWCWVPGPRRVRPVYAPALVAWVGGPAGGVSVAFGANVGWFPLAPREVYVPGYHVSPTYVRNVNITNTTIVNNTYITNVYQNNVTNIHYVNNTAGAVTAVPQNVFTSGQRVGGHAVHLPAEVLARAAVTAAPPAIVPIHQSVLGPNAGRAVARPPAALVSRPVVARTPPPRAPVPFDRQVAAIQQNGGRPLARADLARLQPAAPVAPVRIIAAGGAAVGAGALAHGSGTGRPSNPATPTRPGASAPPAPAGAQAPNLADRERVLQNSRVTPTPRDSNRPPAAARSDSSTAPISPSQAPAPQSRTDRPPSAAQPLPPTQPHAFSSDDPTHAYSRPPAAPVNRPPPAAAAPVSPNPRPQQPQPQPQYQEQRYRPPAPVAAPPPAPVREAPSPPPVSRPQERPAAPPPPAPANRPQERPAAPPAPRPQEAKPESRDSGPHADRTSRDRAER
jgi:hypothetical protein